MDNRAEVRQFLSSRRGRITPEQAGIEPYGGRRRVPGLRREEVARLAGVSVDYYTRLERGNLHGVSDSVLDAIAGALELDRAEHDHLYDLARAANTSGRKRAAGAGGSAPSKVRPELQYLLDAITEAPAFIGNNRLDIVAANTLGYALYSDMYRNPSRPANHSRFIFLDPRAHNFYTDWDRAAHTNVAILRREAGRNPHDKGIAELIGELSMRSDVFRTLWAAHNVRRHYAGTKFFQHPVVGLLELNYQVLGLEEDPGHTLTVYPATPGSTSAEALKLLASWAVTENIVETAQAKVGS
ncbi:MULTISPECIES: helix-turn-helix transcriptional regulator [Pseudarthrobacter]|uniref:Transcriptional regulator with XRE-family HTH domain n=1 Tax=Pseudarthrobacter niigatensis TaxID=369935 RepID=A0AAJ1SXB7_9MICC|nr:MULTISPECIES: helix-turn-helix transcriptional regulator [Pseudarthrobacter]MDQ0145502.1 transcriptional regulator with XRE-family HTH domain [Pseudarthrobacter niigatensis]MDQ0267831.1 transcriptional regulator with XRE-family HTH domain [Pseudarthrobacter niigatensis]QDG62274.1 transcriptional regulator [Pseudarthrobacter sp. NIBRBAC000502771]